MTDERWNALMKDESLNLTPEELREGWHFCWAWDGLLVGPELGEWGDDPKVCGCGEMEVGFVGPIEW